MAIYDISRLEKWIRERPEGFAQCLDGSYISWKQVVGIEVRLLRGIANEIERVLNTSST